MSFLPIIKLPLRFELAIIAAKVYSIQLVTAKLTLLEYIVDENILHNF